MANKTRRREDGFWNFDHAITAGDVMSIGDMVAAVSNKAVPASDFTYAGGVGGTYASLAAAQEAFVLAFLGVTREASRSTDTFTSRVIDKSGYFEFDCASATFEVGDLVGPAGDTSGATYALSNQSVVAVANKARAIGRVVKRGTSVTTVLVEILPRKSGRAQGSVYNVFLPVNLASISGAGDVLTGFVPGHNFDLESVDWFNTVPVTTGAKAASLNAEIDGTNVTGGVVALTSANNTPLGNKVAGSAVTAANRGTPTSIIDIEAASVTAFAEGAGIVVLRIRNLDS